MADAEPKPPKPQVWDRAELLVPVLSSREPELISDGGGLPFAPGALRAGFEPLDPADPPVQALLAQIDASRAANEKRPFWRRGSSRSSESSGSAPTGETSGQDESTKLAGWRVLAGGDGEVLYGRGVPPKLVTVSVGLDPRRDRWTTTAVSAARPLRAARDGIRASSWRVDPTHSPGPEDSELRILVTEQTNSSGRLADGRLLAPDLYIDDEQIILRFFITPLGGYQNRTRRYETPARVALPQPLGVRTLLDGALYGQD